MMKFKIRISNFKLLTSFIAILLLALVSLSQNDGSEQNVTGRPGTFAIVGARIVTVSGGVIENGTVVIQNGRIAAVGPNVSVPSGAEKIDGKGLSVFPGMIDAATNLGLAEIPLGVNASVDVGEIGDMNANARAFIGFNPNSSHVNVTRINGITTARSVSAPTLRPMAVTMFEPQRLEM